MTLGLLRLAQGEKKSEEGQDSNKVNFKKFISTNNMIINLFPQIMLTYLHCWNLSSNFENHKYFTDKGIQPYDFDHYKNYNTGL